jgi:hypothetical protein
MKKLTAEDTPAQLSQRSKLYSPSKARQWHNPTWKRAMGRDRSKEGVEAREQVFTGFL